MPGESPIQQVYVIYPNLQFVYHVFMHELSDEPRIILETASHEKYMWLYPDEALSGKVPLIEDLETNIEMLLTQFSALRQKKE